jgi:4-hydroxybenzoate polyprenyltransferase
MTVAMSLIGKTADYLRLIKFSHSVFALPFAFTGALLAAGGIPEVSSIVWITVAMVGARTGAMGINRIIDRKIDALNPRTEMREIPRGVMSAFEASLFTLFAFVVFVFAAYQLNPLCFMLSPVAILVVVVYPYTKRFTSLSHVVLGLALSFAPFGAWVAVRGSIDMEIFLLSLAVLFWVAGFDIFYALQDLEFDRSHGLYSVPGRLGVRASFMLARGFHFITVVLLLSLIPVFDLGFIYLAGVIISATLLLYEHIIVKPSDLSRLDMAFFTMNGYISITVFLFTLLYYIVEAA